MSPYFRRGEKSVLPAVVIKDAHAAPSPDDPVRMGRVEIDNDKCNGCKLCVMVCLVKSLEMTGKTSVGMTGDSALCIGCGDCVAVCHPGAIDLVKFLEYDGLYKFIGREEASPPRRF